MNRSKVTWATATLLLLPVLLIAAACSGGGGDAGPTATAEAAATPTTAAAVRDTVQVGRSYWHAGFKVTLGEATLENSVVTIEATFENLGNRDARPNSRLALTSGGESYTASSLIQDIPQVPAGLSSSGTLAFDVDEAFSFDDAVLTVGNPDNNQATVPLGPDGGDAVSLEPQEIAVTASATAGAVTVNVTGAELRADLPDQHDEMAAGKLSLTIFFSIDVGSGIQLGQGVFQSPNVALTLPDGTSVAVPSDGASGVNELLQGKEGTTISDLSVRFEVDDPAAGTYVFLVRGAYGPGGADVEGSAEFEVPEPASSGAETPEATP